MVYKGVLGCSEGRCGGADETWGCAECASGTLEMK